MFSDEELDAAVAAGALSAEAAAGLRRFVAEQQATPAVDEEHFRLLTGFNDIFVSIAILLILAAIAWLGGMINPMLGAGAVAATSWGLAEYFTRRRRMALPSILLLLSFVGSIFLMGAGASHENFDGPSSPAFVAALFAALAAAAAYAHWRRFKVPITVAAGAIAAIATLLSLLLGIFPVAQNFLLLLLLVSGIGVFALAMWWDMSDRARTTRRSDVAFWLHLSAAPLIIHPAFSLLGLTALHGDGYGLGSAVAAIAIYLGLAIIALAIDRRALLISALAYVLYAMGALFRAAGSLSLNIALAALVAGAALLLLSAYWHPVRKRIVGLAPAAIRALLPAA